MAFQTGTSSSIQNLMDQLETFAVANGWTSDFSRTELPPNDAGKLGLSKNGVFVAWAWVTSEAGGALAHAANLANDITASQELAAATGDDGGVYSQIESFPTAIENGRHSNNMAGPNTAYWFFEQDANPAYIHVVVEINAGQFRHFGFGELEKIGDWVGGAYHYHHNWNQSNANIDNPLGAHQIGLDAAYTGANQNSPVLHCQGIGDQVAADRWARVCYAGTQGYPNGTDRAGNNMGTAFGGWRGGIRGNLAGGPFTALSAFKPLIPVSVFWWDATITPDQAIYLGNQADVRMINMQNIDPGQTISVAGETWYCFPWVRKQFLQNDTEESRNGGVAYRLETA